MVSGGTRACLLTADAAMTEELDQRLWRHNAGSFVPHRQWAHNGAATASIELLLGWDEPPIDRHEVLINLSEAVPLCFSRFDRLVEIIDAAAPEAGRERYQFYRDRGYPLQTHKISA